MYTIKLYIFINILKIAWDLAKNFSINVSKSRILLFIITADRATIGRGVTMPIPGSKYKQRALICCALYNEHIY